MMTYWGYLITAIIIAPVLGISLTFAIFIATILYIKQHKKPQGHWHQHFQFNQSHNQMGSYHRYLFTTLGYLAKADGVISQKEIHVAQNIMLENGLNFAQKSMAKNAFNDGAKGLNLSPVITYLQLMNRSQPPLVQQFFHYCEQIIHADHYRSMNQINILNQIKFHVLKEHRQYQQPQSPKGELDAAYRLLNIKPSMSFSEMKRTYRKLIGKHHPDRQQTETAKKQAEERMKQYQKAWRVIEKRHKETAT